MRRGRKFKLVDVAVLVTHLFSNHYLRQSTTMEPIFPPEVCDIFIDLLHDDPQTLASCGLVCKDWVPASRSHRFRTIRVNARNHQKLHKLVKSKNVTFLHHVRTVEIDAQWNNHSRMVPNICNDLKKMYSVKSIKLRRMRLNQTDRLALVHTFHGIHDLDLSYIDFVRYDDLERFISGFFALRNLAMEVDHLSYRNVDLEEGEEYDGDEFPVALTLRSLRLADEDEGYYEMQAILDWLSTLEDVPEVQRLIVQGATLVCARKLTLFLRRIAGSLTHLELSLGGELSQFSPSLHVGESSLGTHRLSLYN